VEFQRFSQSNQQFFSRFDQSFQSGNFFSQGLFLLGQVVQQDFPVGLGFFFSTSSGGLFFSD